jgi:hypothetical protein
VYICWVLVAHACNAIATQEEEMGRIEVQSQPQESSWRDPISKISNTQKSWLSGSSGRVPALQTSGSVPQPKKGVYLCII